MSFTSFEFFLFFSFVLLARSACCSLVGEVWLFVIASVVFYLSWSIPSIVLILLTSTVDSYVGAALGRTTLPAARRRLLLTSLALNLGFLMFFKYGNFLLSNVSGILHLLGLQLSITHLNIYLPPAISFFTFTSMSYVIDVYYERIPPAQKLRDYICFVTFFPKLLSGPIVRAGEFLPQLASRTRPSVEDVEIGIAYCIVGAVKKLVIADQIAPHVSLIFSTPGDFDALTLLLGALGYTVQIFCDFSGYSDIAIGLARLLGFQFPENFQMPYSSRNIAEFWRRWHITLSRWFRDYLFLPVEMATRSNPWPTLRVSINMMITMLLCGLWHGASWNFVIWGGVHGAALVGHRLWTVVAPDPKKWSQLAKSTATVLSHTLTISVIVLSMVIFRAESLADAATYLSRMLLGAHGTRLLSPYILSAVAIVFLLHLVVKKDTNFALELPKMSIVPRLASYTALLFFLVVFAATDSSAFIYFQF